jgi:hypothetical protein
MEDQEDSSVAHRRELPERYLLGGLSRDPLDSTDGDEEISLASLPYPTSDSIQHDSWKNDARHSLESQALQPRNPTYAFLGAAGSSSDLDSQNNSIKSQGYAKISRQSFFRSWWLEIGATLLSVAAFISVLGVLVSQNGKPLTNWSFAAASVNSVAATLGTLSRVTAEFAVAACLGQQKWNQLHKQPQLLQVFEKFDASSRGPWGSLKLLYSLGLRYAIFIFVR